MSNWVNLLTVAAGLATVGLSAQPNIAAEFKQDGIAQSHSAAYPADATNKEFDSDTSGSHLITNPPHWYTPLKKPDWWVVIVAGLTSLVIGWQSWETRKAAEAARDSIRTQEAGMTQWIDLRPHSLYYTIAEDSPQPKVVTIHPSWRVVNSTPLPFNLIKIEVNVARDDGWEVFEYDVDEVVPPLADGKNYFTFSASIILAEDETAQFLEDVTELSIAIHVLYLGAHGKESSQSFGEFYDCKPGSLTINESLGKGPQNQRLEKYDGPSTIKTVPGVAVMGSRGDEPPQKQS